MNPVLTDAMKRIRSGELVGAARKIVARLCAGATSNSAEAFLRWKVWNNYPIHTNFTCRSAKLRIPILKIGL